MKKRHLILVRHGQSEWNAKNLFTGWKDPGLTDEGMKEALVAGSTIKSEDILFDEMFTSKLVRAQITGKIILEAINQSDIPINQNIA
jgi:2,3-bisphosphoglycerate-dependent phosphoglycerate mutase